MQAAVDNGVEVLTLYAFSSENWKRSTEEISDLTGLMRFYLERELNRLMDEGVRLRLIGDYSAFGPEMVEKLEKFMDALRESGDSCGARVNVVAGGVPAWRRAGHPIER